MIIVGRQHDLGLAKAKRLAESIARRLEKDYGGSSSWKGNELHFQRTGASGRVTVTKDDFQVRVELGLLLMPLTARIEREIHAFCDEHFGDRDRPAPSGSTAARPAPRSNPRR
jgi:putative polyhydroxyalkanoate system protein